MTWNKRLFDALFAEREEIEAEFAEALEWERLDHRRASRIAAKRPGSIEASHETLDEIQEWAIDRLLRFRCVFGPRISALIAAGGTPGSYADHSDVEPN